MCTKTVHLLFQRLSQQIRHQFRAGFPGFFRDPVYLVEDSSGNMQRHLPGMIRRFPASTFPFSTPIIGSAGKSWQNRPPFLKINFDAQ